MNSSPNSIPKNSGKLPLLFLWPMDPSTMIHVFWVCPAVHRRLRRCGTGRALHMLHRTWDEFMVQIWCSLQGLIVEKNPWNMIWMINKEVHFEGKWHHIHEAGFKQHFSWRLVNWHLSGPSVTCQSSWRLLLREINLNRNRKCVRPLEVRC